MLYIHVYVSGGEELDQVVADYAKMGFPGCVGSMDVTHLMCCGSSVLRLCGMFVLDVIIVQA